MQLTHEPQGETGACLYFATYALTHDPAWLAYARDGPGDPTDELLWLSRLAQAGVAIFHSLVIQRSYADPVGPAFWEWQRAHTHAIQPGQVPLMVTFLGQSQVLYHAVAVVLDTTTGDVSVSDSCQPALQHFTWAAFLDTRYARAYRVSMLAAFPDSAG
ncbi:hypothetical protein [uncultured Deinococcus sp.]|uniref:hypothetical protein n=1 Tax=uncultured Deinococcus sp. TaxID=158789 RepID=UPI00258997AD|nr:hypothetical protein [uncultured Deinococcus sp.]